MLFNGKSNEVLCYSYKVELFTLYLGRFCSYTMLIQIMYSWHTIYTYQLVLVG